MHITLSPKNKKRLESIRKSEGLSSISHAIEWVLMNYDISKRIDAVISALEDKYIHNDSVAGKELTDIPGVFKIVKDSDV